MRVSVRACVYIIDCSDSLERVFATEVYSWSHLAGDPNYSSKDIVERLMGTNYVGR